MKSLRFSRPWRYPSASSPMPPSAPAFSDPPAPISEAAAPCRQINFISSFFHQKLLNSFSMISARVATVPSPPVSPSILRAFASRDSMYLTGFSIAVSRVASVNLAGGFVFPVVREIWLMDSCSPFLRSGRGCSQDCQEASSSSGSSRKELSAALEES